MLWLGEVGCGAGGAMPGKAITHYRITLVMGIQARLGMVRQGSAWQGEARQTPNEF